ncbi:MAG TPA: thiamine-phosphate kinase [Dermatophilaceae bacterium]|jgi:thiamine-monophosphate kinase|uniref:Thiamine-monophosphate kinase n=1 Tax=Candidatus Phosphoribacter hodrii TaxID=2953743 RepID=A0A935CEG2_9MICO|nr:thiamine-phosphate kinase [Candidatus Phosphoribacter hodrii]HNV13894.1 thiamine-phosphate kinase [Dermatophilaceae bacterium]MBL0004339.1 thiamine-phosphate kinase [Candidatus Phosphoribacter hodrii]HOA01294.1 thiamine-phosphate kinase [Dermatophilaceae bacterium]HPV79127.1 thiamine-phosphate kinase [Dermatophilaceae bacterium]
MTLADLTEEQLLARITPRLPGGPGVLVGPGDDTAVLRCDAATIITTDAAVRGRDWRDDWSTPGDVGAKIVAQNLADVAAMGGRPLGLVVTLLADPATTVAWVEGFADGLGEAARTAGAAVLGGDLSSAPRGTLAVSVTALGTLDGQAPVLRSGACAGDQVAVAGTLGRSAAGLLLLERGRPELDEELVATHRRPQPPLAEGPRAGAAGAAGMLDISDGLLRDGARIASASGVALDLSREALAPYAARLAPAVGADDAWECVLGGGEEHSLLACFAGPVPAGWTVIGMVRTGAGVLLDGIPQAPRGWDHFRR